MKLPKLKDQITRQEYDVILVIMDRLTKWGYFIAYIEEILAEDVARIYIKKVFAWYRLLKKIIFNKDLRFIAVFWEMFLIK